MGILYCNLEQCQFKLEKLRCYDEKKSGSLDYIKCIKSGVKTVPIFDFDFIDVRFENKR